MGAYLPEWLFKSNLFDPISLSFSFWTGCTCSGLSTGIHDNTVNKSISQEIETFNTSRKKGFNFMF